ncbi:hypothetical protein B566_EDAN017265 [Ephemera danica]|nr:hypothetical protein B566_EDAN017265 [Ephemera danica]
MLRELCELYTALIISYEQVTYMHELTIKYLTKLRDNFPNYKLKCKHHYIRHYAQLTLRFGPLIKHFTLRYESKHKMFKKIAKNCNNFIQVTKTFALKHQLYFAYCTTNTNLGAVSTNYNADSTTDEIPKEIIKNLNSINENSSNIVSRCKDLHMEGIMNTFVRNIIKNITEDKVSDIVKILQDAGFQEPSELDRKLLPPEYFYTKFEPVFANKLFLRAEKLRIRNQTSVAPTSEDILPLLATTITDTPN